MLKIAMNYVPGHYGQKVLRDESGAVTVDWVVLTSALIIFGLVAWTIIQGGIQEGASNIRAGVLSSIG